MVIAPGDLNLRVEKGIRLFKLRANSRWYAQNQEAFAHKIGYTGLKAASNISRVENGERGLPESKEEAAAEALAQDPDLVDDSEYLLGFLQCEHADLRGCLAARPKFRLVEDEPAIESTEAGENGLTIPGWTPLPLAPTPIERKAA